MARNGPRKNPNPAAVLNVGTTLLVETAPLTIAVIAVASNVLPAPLPVVVEVPPGEVVIVDPLVVDPKAKAVDPVAREVTDKVVDLVALVVVEIAVVVVARCRKDLTSVLILMRLSIPKM